MPLLRSIAATAVIGISLAACGTPEYPNTPLPSAATNEKSQSLPAAISPEEPLIIMAFSGGGSRATALALSVLQRLRSVTYQIDGKTETLLDNVQIVSSVSGGSVTAGYLGLNGIEGIDNLTEDFLKKDNMAALEWTAVNPITWLSLTIGNESRIDVLRDLFDQRIFHNATFGDLKKKKHPIIVLNATDMVSGEVFAFTPERFDDICSNLDGLRLSVGVASSAAFPVALSPMDLKNYSGSGCKVTDPAPRWINTNLNILDSRYVNIEEYKRARYAYALRRGKGAFRDIEYVHLLDGGVADNQGIRSLTDVLFSPHGPVHILDAINRGQRKKIVVITVNARSDPPSDLDQYAGTPGIISMIESVTSVPLDAATASLNSEMQNLIESLRVAGADAKKAATQSSPEASFADLKVYGITIDFDQFRPGQEDLRDQVKKIGTTWTLTDKDLKAVDDAATLLLRQHPCFQRLLMDINAPGVTEPDLAMQDCRVSD